MKKKKNIKKENIAITQGGKKKIKVFVCVCVYVCKLPKLMDVFNTYPKNAKKRDTHEI